MENNNRVNERTYGIGYLIVSILLFIGTIGVILYAFNCFFNVFSDIERGLERETLSVIAPAPIKETPAPATKTTDSVSKNTTIINNYTTNVDNSTHITVNGNENTVNNNCGNSITVNGNNNTPYTPCTPAYPTCNNKEEKKVCCIDGYNNYTYVKYRWNEIINIKNYSFASFKPTFNKAYIEIKGYIVSTQNSEYFILREEKNGRDHMIWCMDNATIRQFVNSNNLCKNTPVIIRGQINGGFEDSHLNEKLFNIDVWCVEIIDN